MTGWGVSKTDIDLGLAVLRSVCPDRPMNCVEIAEVCGCHHSRIDQIEKQAIRKIRGRLHHHGIMVEDLKLFS